MRRDQLPELFFRLGLAKPPYKFYFCITETKVFSAFAPLINAPTEQFVVDIVGIDPIPAICQAILDRVGNPPVCAWYRAKTIRGFKPLHLPYLIAYYRRVTYGTWMSRLLLRWRLLWIK